MSSTSRPRRRLKIIVTSDHISEIARLREVPVHAGTGLQTELITARAVGIVLLGALVVAGIFIKRRLRNPESER